MEDEVKEKIRQWYVDDDLISILDYITNLQKENERLIKINKEQANRLISKDNLSYKDYKSRCEKAREMIRFIAYNSERPLTISELNKVYNMLGGE